MKSMTGYGKGICAEGGREVTVEIKTVNNRFLEIASRIPKTMQAMDDLLRALVQKRVKRGSAELYLHYSSMSESQTIISADFPLIQSYAALAREVNAKTGIENDLTFASLIRMPDLVKAQPMSQDPSVYAALVKKAAGQAIKNLDRMRAREGRAIKTDLKKLLDSFESTLSGIKARAPEIQNEYRAKLKARITDYLKQVEIDETRLLNEVAFFADKSDVNEELQRLDSHLTQFKEALDDKEPAGRKLDFISQEIGREVNTLGSKANDLTLTNGVVELKNILEKIKEQIRNIE